MWTYITLFLFLIFMHRILSVLFVIQNDWCWNVARYVSASVWRWICKVLIFHSEVFCLKVQLYSFDIWQRSFLLEGATGYSCARVEGRTGSGTGEGDGGWIQDAAVLLLVPRPLLVWVGLAPVLRVWPTGLQWLVAGGCKLHVAVMVRLHAPSPFQSP